MSSISIGTVIDMNRRDGRDLAEWRSQAMAKQPCTAIEAALGALDIDAHRLSNNLSLAYKRRPIGGGIAYIAELTVLNGPGGEGKTTIILGWALAWATGRPLMGGDPMRPRNVLVLNMEDSRGSVGLSLQAAYKHHHLRPHDVRRLAMFGVDDLPGLVLTEIDPRTNHPRLSTAGVERIRQLVVASSADVLILDPWSRLVPIGENDNGLMYAVMGALKQMAINLDCAIIIVAHTTKGSTRDGNDGQESTRGAGAITNAARVVLGARRGSSELCAQIGVPFGAERDIRELVDQKSNYAPISEGRYYRLIGVPMGNALPPDYPDEDWVAVAVPFTPCPGGRQLPLLALKAALTQLAQGVTSGAGQAPYSPVKRGPKAGSRYYGADLAAALQPHLPLSGAALDAAAREAFEAVKSAGWIDTPKMPIPGTTNHRQGVLVSWSASPWASEPKPPGQFVR